MGESICSGCSSNWENWKGSNQQLLFLLHVMKTRICLPWKKQNTIPQVSVFLWDYSFFLFVPLVQETQSSTKCLRASQILWSLFLFILNLSSTRTLFSCKFWEVWKQPPLLVAERQFATLRDKKTVTAYDVWVSFATSLWPLDHWPDIFLSPVAQQAKNPPAMQGTQKMCALSLDKQDPLEEEMATHSTLVFLPKNPMDRGAWRATVQRVTKS